MNNNFKVLWFEDETNWFRMGKKKLSKSLESNYSLIADIQNLRNKQDFDISILKTNQYDLILMDYNLVEGYVGDEIIKLIRSNNILTDILFYSSEYKKMIESVKESIPAFDGIYLTKRDNSIFFKKTENIISKIVRRSEDIVNLRGMVLDATSEFELIVKQFIPILWDNATQDNRDCIKKIIIDKILNHYNTMLSESISKFSSGELSLKNLNKGTLFSMNDRLTIITEYSKKISKSLKLKDQDFNQYYTNNLSAFRNALGHKKIDEYSGGKIKVCAKEYDIDEKLFKMLRENIVELNLIFKPTLDSLLNNEDK